MKKENEMTGLPKKVVINGQMHNVSVHPKTGAIRTNKPRTSRYQSHTRWIEISEADLLKLQTWDSFKIELAAAKASKSGECQICGNSHLTNRKGGKLPHHGYQRPGNGWQTASCPGAKHLPYSQSRDRIPHVLEMIETHRRRTTRSLAALRSHEFSEVFHMKRPGKYDYKRGTRGEAIDYHLEVNSPEWDQERKIRIRLHERDIEGDTQSIAYFTKRYDDWKPTK